MSAAQAISVMDVDSNEEQQPESPSMDRDVNSPEYVYCPVCTYVTSHRWDVSPSVEAKPLSNGGHEQRHTSTGAVDWHDYYWGYTDQTRHMRRTILRPLPHTIADRIPLELTDRVVDWIQPDRRDLYNCALVCRAWHNRSQTLLYFRVFLADAEAYDSLARFAIQSPRSSRYLSSTRMLEIHVDDEAPSPSPRTTRAFVHAVPIVLGRSMPHLQCLSLRNCLHPPYHDSFVTFMSQFTAVQHLWLDNFELKSFADFRRIICSLPRLRDLHLAGGRLVNASPSIPPSTDMLARSGTPRLRRLSIDGLAPSFLSLLVPWLSSTPMCTAVDYFMLSISDVPGSRLPNAEVLVLLRTLGSALKWLYLQNFGEAVPPLSHHPNLVQVCLTMVVALKNTCRRIVEILYGILCQISSSHMRVIDLHLRFTSETDKFTHSTWLDDDFDDTDLAPIHELAGASTFDSLTEVGVILTMPNNVVLGLQDTGTAVELCDRVRLILQPWHARGILDIFPRLVIVDKGTAEADGSYSAKPTVE